MSLNITFSNYHSKIALSMVSIWGPKLAPPWCWDEFSVAGNDRVKRLKAFKIYICIWGWVLLYFLQNRGTYKWHVSLKTNSFDLATCYHNTVSWQLVGIYNNGDPYITNGYIFCFTSLFIYFIFMYIIFLQSWCLYEAIVWCIADSQEGQGWGCQ